MCVIIYSPNSDNRPTMKTLDKCEKANPHGIGVAMAGSKKMFQVNKAISLDYLKHLVRNEEGPLAIHFRFATAGGEGKELCHPFPCTAKAETWLDYKASEILFTNGTWINWIQSYSIIKSLNNMSGLGKTMSDTRALAHIIGSTRKSSFLKDISDKHPSEKRVRALYMSKAIKDQHRLFGDWHDFEGCKFSNLRFKKPPIRAFRTSRQADLPFHYRKATKIASASSDEILGNNIDISEYYGYSN